MDKELKIQKVEVEANTRIIALSDIHGMDNYLEGVLKKVGYTTKDVLVIVGDVIEKGEESLKTVRRILKLKEENPYVYVTLGNVDYDRLELFYREGEQADYDFAGTQQWTRKVWKRGFFLDILEEMRVDLEELTGEKISLIKERIRREYARELSLFEEASTILEIGNYVFVHGGIPTDRLEELKGEDMFSFLKRETFLKEEVVFQKYVIVGHWPTCLYSDEIDCMNPIFDSKKHIIAIDGGCALKYGAQLNALLISSAYAPVESVSYEAYDDLPAIVAKKSQAAKERTVTIRYFDCKVELLENLEDVAKVRHVSTGMEFLVPKSYLYGRDDQFYNCSDFSDTCLEIAVGDKLSVIQETSMGYIVKKDGVIGWYIP
ncbi:MAG: metallophosphoesterase [Lachnospiraceae bacterium]|nr:metallophosphoesterase [Lachnospiraceae bacterium]